MSVSSAIPPLPLPRVSGPKLDPFRGTATADLEFIRFVGGEDDVDSKVWKVSIDGKYYALKIFPFKYWKVLMNTTGEYITTREGDPQLTPQEYLDYLDPFNNECRVYGRLKQETRDDIAIRAHGYILLTPEQENKVTEAHGKDYVNPKTQTDLGSDELDEDSIVKDFVDEGTPGFDKSQILQMYDDMETLHSLGILIRDIHPGNYLGGKLIDFSCSLTMYHPCLDRISWLDLRQMRIEEPIMFNNMIVAWSNVHDTDIPMPRALEEWSGGVEDCGINPCAYDWRKWEKVDEADISGEDALDG